MGEKITIDRVNKVINITEAPVLENGEYVLDFDIKIDLYSDAKEDWVTNSDLRVRAFPLSAVGGNPTVGAKKLGSTFFIEADWKIALYPFDHRFRVNGNFYSKDGTSPFLLPAGNSVLLEQEVSSLVDSTVQQLPEIEGMSFGGVISVDITSSNTGTKYPNGNKEYPVNNLTDALLINSVRGLDVISTRKDLTLSDGHDVSGLLITGRDAILCALTIETEAFCEETVFKNLYITGIFDGHSSINDCIVGDITYFSGTINYSALAGYIQLAGNANAHLHNCYLHDYDVNVVIDIGGEGQNLIMTEWTGKVTIKELTGSDNIVGIGMLGGIIVIDSSCNAGNVTVTGNGIVIDNSPDSCVVNTLALNNPKTIAKATWDYELPVFPSETLYPQG